MPVGCRAHDHAEDERPDRHQDGRGISHGGWQGRGSGHRGHYLRAPSAEHRRATAVTTVFYVSTLMDAAAARDRLLKALDFFIADLGTSLGDGALTGGAHRKTPSGSAAIYGELNQLRGL